MDKSEIIKSIKNTRDDIYNMLVVQNRLINQFKEIGDIETSNKVILLKRGYSYCFDKINYLIEKIDKEQSMLQ